MIDEIPTKTEKRTLIFTDTDVLSAFLWRNSFGYVVKLFDKLGYRMVIPDIVLEELSYNKKTTTRLAQPILSEFKKGTVDKLDIQFGSIESDYYINYTEEQRLGRGEAAALSLARSHAHSAIASNNLRDVKRETQRLGIELWTVPDILFHATKESIISPDRANDLWKKMREDGMRLPKEYDTFSDYADAAKKQT